MAEVTEHQGVLSPDSASKCDDDVCLNVTGSGLHISEWTTTAFGNVGCTVATADWLHGSTYGAKHSKIICPDGTGPGIYYWGQGPTGNFPDGTAICNYWDEISGYPCAEVHS